MKKKAPNYFENDIERAKKVEERLSESLGVGVSWLKQKNGDEILDYATDLKFSQGKLEKVAFLLTIQEVFFKYAWAHFRYRNRNNEFGMAEQLAYDPGESKIMVEKSWTSKTWKKIKSLISQL